MPRDGRIFRRENVKVTEGPTCVPTREFVFTVFHIINSAERFLIFYRMMYIIENVR